MCDGISIINNDADHLSLCHLHNLFMNSLITGQLLYYKGLYVNDAVKPFTDNHLCCLQCSITHKLIKLEASSEQFHSLCTEIFD